MISGGTRAASEIDGLKGPKLHRIGIKGATVPLLSPGGRILRTVKSGADSDPGVTAVGKRTLDYSWLHDGRIVPAPRDRNLKLIARHRWAKQATYTVLVHNREGTAVSRDLLVSVGSLARTPP